MTSTYGEDLNISTNYSSSWYSDPTVEIEIKESAKKAIKKFDETCERIAKNEPKVWLTVEEARFARKWLNYLSAEGNAFPLKEKHREDLWDFGWSLTERIKQAEGKE